MIGMFLLKHTYVLSDEQVRERWVHDPYFQYFTGEEFFQHELPHERSGMSHWRKRIGDRLDILLHKSLRIAHDTGALKKSDLARVTIDTTVQPTRSLGNRTVAVVPTPILLVSSSVPLWASIRPLTRGRLVDDYRRPGPFSGMAGICSSVRLRFPIIGGRTKEQ